MVGADKSPANRPASGKTAFYRPSHFSRRFMGNQREISPFHAEHHGGNQPPTTASTTRKTCSVASAAQQSTTIRSGILRNHVSWRLHNCRVANTPLSRMVGKSI